MAEDTEQLVVMLEARIRDFERNLDKANRTATKTYQALTQGSTQATRQMEADMVRSTGRVNQALAATSTRIGTFSRSFLIGGLAAGATAAIAPILSLSAALNTAKKAMEDFSKTCDVAARLGVHVERLQELRFAAEQGGMAVDNFDTAFRRFIRRSSEAALGTGAAVGAFRELGVELRDNEGRLKESDRLLGEVADALQRVQSPADRLRLAFRMFDTDGAAMVNVLANGSKGLDDFARRARDLGIVVDRDLIERSRELKAEFDTATRVIDLQFKQALVSLAPVLIQIAGLAARLAGDIRSMVDAFRSLETKTSEGLDTRMRTLGLERLRIENEILDIQHQQREMSGLTAALERRYLDGTIKHKRDELARIADEEQRILEILQSRQQVTNQLADSGTAVDMTAEYLKTFRHELSLTSDQRRLATETQRILNDATAKGADLTREQAEELAKLVIQRNEAERAAGRSATSMGRERGALGELVNATVERINQLRLETTLIGATAAAAETMRVEFELLTRAMDRGIAVSPALAGHFREIAREAGEAAEAFNAARLEHDLLFERQQAMRLSIDQRVHAELRAASIDIASAAGQRLAYEIKITEELHLQNKAWEDQARVIKDSIGGAFTEVFKGGIRDFDGFMDHMTRGLSRLAEENIKKLFDFGPTGIWAQQAANAAFLPQMAGEKAIRKAIEDGSRKGSQEGSMAGTFAGVFQSMGMAPDQAKMFGGAASGALGAFGMGYQSANPITGAIGGTMQGFAAEERTT